MSEKQEFMENLNLENLSLPEFETGYAKKFFERSRMEQEQYKEKYGSKWYRKWCRHEDTNYDMIAHYVNTIIYTGRPYTGNIGTPGSVIFIMQKWKNRMCELYGPNYENLLSSSGFYPNASELLLEDALKTGKWRELPDALQIEYKERKANAVL